LSLEEKEAAVSAATHRARHPVIPNNKKRKTKKKRASAGMAALRQIRFEQASQRLLIPKAAFARVVKEMIVEVCEAKDLGSEGRRITGDALLGLQEAAEALFVERFELSQLAAIHARRVTVTPKDGQLVMRITNDARAFNPTNFA